MSPNLRSNEIGEDDEQYNVLHISVDDGDEIMPVEGWQGRDIGITLDSGCCNQIRAFSAQTWACSGMYPGRSSSM